MINKYKICGNWDEISIEYDIDTLSIISSVANAMGNRQYLELVRSYSKNFKELEELDVPSEEDEGIEKQTVSFVRGLSSSDVASKMGVFQINKGTEMHQVQNIRIPYSETLSKFCKLSKNLRSRAVFLGRQLYFLRTNKLNYNLAKQYPKLAEQLLDYMETKLDSPELYEELRQKLYINPTMQISRKLFSKLNKFEYSEGLNTFLKFEDCFKNLGAIYSQLPTQVLRNVASDWKSYRENHKNWKIYPELYKEEPRIPSKNRKTDEFLLTFSGTYVNNRKYASTIVDRFINTRRPTRNSKRLKKQLSKYCTSGELILPNEFLKKFSKLDPFPIVRTTIDIESIKEVKIVPKKIFYEIQIGYYAQKLQNNSLNPLRAYTIDIGVNDLIGLANNFGEQSIIIRGRPIKAINQWMNKNISKLRSAQTIGMTMKKGVSVPETSEMTRIRRKRDAVIDDYFHKVSRFVINCCLSRRAKNLAIGYNAGWKKDLTSREEKKMRYDVKQNFAYLPFYKLIKMIEYKAELVGINVVRIGESHTSKCSSIDFEPIEHHDKYIGRRGVYRKGPNKPSRIAMGKPKLKYYKARGLFKTRDPITGKPIIMHSDINASFNIGRKAFPDLFNKNTLKIRDMVKPPRTVCVYKYEYSEKKKRSVKHSCAMV